jgi:hypothetical protein
METCTAGSESGLGKRTDGNIGTAPQADSTIAHRDRAAPTAYGLGSSAKLSARWK